MKNKTSGIYCIKNIVNNKMYIGLTNDISRRRREHLSALRNNKHENRHLQNSWNFYKEESFVFYVLEECSTDMLDEREKYYISKYQSNNDKFGYNMESGGRSEQEVSDETRKKMSDSLKGREFSEEHKLKISKALTGREFSDESKEKMRQAKVGKMNGENHPRHRPVYSPELDKEFWGAKEVEDLYGIDRTYIYACLSGRQKSAGKHPVTGEKLHWFAIDSLQTIQN
jgi:group I intron endonuclease